MEQERFEMLVAQSPDAMVFADPAGRILVWNAAATRVFGFAADTAIGSDLDIIIPERFREAHHRGYAHAVAAAATKYEGQSLATRALRADGTQIYVELGFAVVTDAGRVLGVLATARDITERFERDRADRARLRELEAERQRS